MILSSMISCHQHPSKICALRFLCSNKEENIFSIPLIRKHTKNKVSIGRRKNQFHVDMYYCKVKSKNKSWMLDEEIILLICYHMTKVPNPYGN